MLTEVVERTMTPSDLALRKERRKAWDSSVSQVRAFYEGCNRAIQVCCACPCVYAQSWFFEGYRRLRACPGFSCLQGLAGCEQADTLQPPVT